jgi:N-methylhydantoinase A
MSGGRRCAELVRHAIWCPFDMGASTSSNFADLGRAKASLSADGITLAGQRIALQPHDIASIAAGGSSIAASMPATHVARRSGKREPVPGPACYGNGGLAATVTDANVVISWLSARAFAGR